MSKILLSSLNGDKLIDTFITQTDQYGTHYFRTIKDMKDWYATTQANRTDIGGYKNIDDFDGSILVPETATIQTIVYKGYTFQFKSESNAKKWILERKGAELNQ